MLCHVAFVLILLRTAGEFRLVGITTHYIILTHRLDKTWLSLMGDDQHQNLVDIMAGN